MADPINRNDPRLHERHMYVDSLLRTEALDSFGYIKVVNRIDRLLRLRMSGAPDNLIGREKTLLLDAVNEVVQYDDVEPIPRGADGELPPIAG